MFIIKDEELERGAVEAGVRVWNSLEYFLLYGDIVIFGVAGVPHNQGTLSSHESKALWLEVDSLVTVTDRKIFFNSIIGKMQRTN